MSAEARIRINSLLWTDFLTICKECEIHYNRRLEILIEQDIRTYRKLSESDSLDEVEPEDIEVKKMTKKKKPAPDELGGGFADKETLKEHYVEEPDSEAVKKLKESLY